MSDEISVQLPLVDKQLRCCKGCHRVLTEFQFLKEGCSSCRTGPVKRKDIDAQTTSNFSGYVGIIDPKNSWVARVIGATKDTPIGIYAAAAGDDQSSDDGSEEDTTYIPDADEEEEQVDYE